mgnify:CR=1 FL=1
MSSESLRGATVLVTGATGFIGSHLVDRLLSEGANVRYLIRPASPRGGAARHLPAPGAKPVLGDLITGAGLFLSEAMKCYASTAFTVKMTCLAIAIAFTFTVRTSVTSADEGRVRSSWRKAVALVSLALWFGVAASGRWIGFSG